MLQENNCIKILETGLLFMFGFKYQMINGIYLYEHFNVEVIIHNSKGMRIITDSRRNMFQRIVWELVALRALNLLEFLCFYSVWRS